MEGFKNFVYNNIIVPVINFLHLLVTKYLTWTLLGIAFLIIALVLIIILLTKKERNAYRLAQYQYRYNTVDSLSQEEVQNIAHNVPDKDVLYKNLSESKEEAQKQMELNDPQYTYNQQKQKRLEKLQQEKQNKKQKNKSKQEITEEVQEPTQESKEKTKNPIKETIKKIIGISEPQQPIIEEVKVEEAKPVQETKTTYTGKWKIYTLDDGRLFATLTASNGGVLLKTEPYSSITSIRNGIETIKKYVSEDNFIIFVDKEGRYRFKIITKQNKLICSSETYSTKAKCDGGINSVKKFINSAQVIRID